MDEINSANEYANKNVNLNHIRFFAFILLGFGLLQLYYNGIDSLSLLMFKGFSYMLTGYFIFRGSQIKTTALAGIIAGVVGLLDNANYSMSAVMLIYWAISISTIVVFLQNLTIDKVEGGKWYGFPVLLRLQEESCWLLAYKHPVNQLRFKTINFIVAIFVLLAATLYLIFLLSLFGVMTITIPVFTQNYLQDINVFSVLSRVPFYVFFFFVLFWAHKVMWARVLVSIVYAAMIFDEVFTFLQMPSLISALWMALIGFGFFYGVEKTGAHTSK
jgi:hypothetical protein